MIKRIIIHCSATKEGADFNAADIDRWHKKRGWSGIGYHYVIKLDGTIEKGRSINRWGAHTKGYNKYSYGVCYIGGLDKNGKPKDTRTDAQKESLRKLMSELKSIHKDAEISGHNEFSSKACPCFNVKGENYG